ncbi:hypothetical protein F7725_018334 [Dissostichus mawsoni]|uniref:D-ribitol-5-phosphate cytidylyltransferase n=1 Tax=Dissostichus mawsoni TaxID=36200 RepID=A0A7J5XSS4_DISMA|nr:hypothetical protein F7725_018334 [Dissostichus mawsoni]
MEDHHKMQSDSCDPDRPTHPGTFPTCEAGRSDHQPAERSVDFPVSVVLPAGGTGERTGLQTPKQFCLFMGRPLISYTIQAFERVSWIQSIVVVVAKEHMDLMTDIVQQFQHMKAARLATGRYNGVLAVGEEERPKVVLIHDAVRPFAAGAIRPLVSTVIATTSEGYLDHSLERAKYRASEMPQDSHMMSSIKPIRSESDFEFGTECLHLALQYCGTNAKLIQGPPTLWKVTYKRDLAAAESIIKDTLSRSACVITGGSAQAVTLAGALQKAVGALNMELAVIPDLTGENGGYLLKDWNFIQVSVNRSCLSEVEALLTDLEAAKQALLHPLVVILVSPHTDTQFMVLQKILQGYRSLTGNSMSCLSVESGGARSYHGPGLSSKAPKYSSLWHPASSVKGHPALGRSVSRVAEITSALIRDRSPALVGQLLQA